MRILFVKIMIPCVMLGIFLNPFIGVLFFMTISFVRLEVLTWGMIDARFALITSGVTLGSWLLRIKEPKQLAKRVPAQFWFFLVILLMVTLSTIHAEASHRLAWKGNEKFFKYAMFLFLMVQMINTAWRFRWVQETLFWGVNFLAVWGIDQYFRGNYRLERVGGGDFADSSGLAALMNLMFPMVLYRVYHPNLWVKVSGVLFGVAYLVVLMFTQSRSGFLGGAISLLIIFSRARHKLRYILMAVPLGYLLLQVMPDDYSDRLETIFSKDDTETGETRERSADQRLKVWVVAWEVFKEHPLLGVGRANFGLVHTEPAYRIWFGKIDDELFEDLFLRPRACHSFLFDMLASYGLFVTIPWFLMVFSVPFSLWRMRSKLGRRPMDDYWRFQSYGLECGILGFLVTGLFHDLFEIEVFYWIVVLAGIMRTVVEKWLEENPPPPPPDPSKRRPGPPAVSGTTPPLKGEGPLNVWHTGGVAP